MLIKRCFAAAKAGCAEMVDYCRDCLEYEKLFSDNDRLSKATQMLKKYLTAGCDAPVNIPDTQLKAIQKQADAPTPTMFKRFTSSCSSFPSRTNAAIDVG